MQDVPPPGSSDNGPPRRRSRGGRGRRGGRGGGGGYDDRGPAPPPLPDALEEVSAEPSEPGRRRPVPRDQLLNPTPIPGRLRSDAEEGLDSIMSELERSPPPAPTDAPPPRERDDRRGPPRSDRGDRGGRGGRGGRPHRDDTPEPRAAGPASHTSPAREAPMTSTSTPPVATRTDDDDFGAGLFDAPAVRAPAPRAAPAASHSPPPAAAPAPKKADDEDDGFGAGLL